MELETSTPPGPARASWVAVEACTLPTAEQPLRVAEFDDLFAHALRAVEYPHATAEQARLVLRGDEALAGRVQRLADAETACCSFFTFSLTPLDGDESGNTVLALDVGVPTDHSHVLAALVQRAERFLRPAS
jgi:transglutaminase-like putative cysteine protease